MANTAPNTNLHAAVQQEDASQRVWLQAPEPVPTFSCCVSSLSPSHSISSAPRANSTQLPGMAPRVSMSSVLSGSGSTDCSTALLTCRRNKQAVSPLRSAKQRQAIQNWPRSACLLPLKPCAVRMQYNMPMCVLPMCVC